jgi:hypothetical protein
LRKADKENKKERFNNKDTIRKDTMAQLTQDQIRKQQEALKKKREHAATELEKIQRKVKLLIGEFERFESERMELLASSPYGAQMQDVNAAANHVNDAFNIMTTVIRALKV